MRNWKTTLGGALQALGTALTGYGLVPILGQAGAADVPPDVFGIWCVKVGFLISAFGSFFGLLFAADKGQLANLTEEVKNQTDFVKRSESDGK